MCYARPHHKSPRPLGDYVAPLSIYKHQKSGYLPYLLLGSHEGTSTIINYLTSPSGRGRIKCVSEGYTVVRVTNVYLPAHDPLTLYSLIRTWCRDRRHRSHEFVDIAYRLLCYARTLTINFPSPSWEIIYARFVI